MSSDNQERIREIVQEISALSAELDRLVINDQNRSPSSARKPNPFAHATSSVFAAAKRGFQTTTENSNKIEVGDVVRIKNKYRGNKGKHATVTKPIGNKFLYVRLIDEGTLIQKKTTSLELVKKAKK